MDTGLVVSGLLGIALGIPVSLWVIGMRKHNLLAQGRVIGRVRRVSGTLAFLPTSRFRGVYLTPNERSLHLRRWPRWRTHGRVEVYCFRAVPWEGPVPSLWRRRLQHGLSTELVRLEVRGDAGEAVLQVALRPEWLDWFLSRMRTHVGPRGV